MERIVLTVLASAVLCGTTVSAMCDNTTSAKIKDCVFKSDLVKTNSLPLTAESVTSYCTANATVNCLATELGDCTGNDRQTKLINQLLTYDNIVMGQKDLCNSTALATQSACFDTFQTADTKNCLDTAVGALTNVGDTTDLKAGLDAMCTFFDAYSKCLTDECSIFQAAVNGLKYPYCNLDAAGRQAVVTDYETGSASAITVGIMSVIIAIVTVNVF